MLKHDTVLRFALLLALLASLSACGPAPTPAPTALPTIDPAVIQTQAAATIYAELTASAPTITPTPLPSATPTTPPPTPTASETNTPGTPVPTLPEATATTQSIIGDGARCVGTAPHSGAEIRPNEIFNLEFDLLNVGTTVWTPGYRLVYAAGERFTNVTAIQLDRRVEPGQKGVFILGTFGSEEMNAHYTYWQLYNDKGIAVEGGYCEFWYQPV